MLTGNLASIGVGGIIASVSSYLWPDDFDFDITRAINSPDGKAPQLHHHDLEETNVDEKDEKHSPVPSADVHEVSRETSEQFDLDIAGLKKAFRFAAWSSVVLLIILILIIPFSLFGTQTVYGVRGLTAWVVIGIVWAFFGSFIVVLYPLYESRVALKQVGRGLIKDIFAKGGGKYTVPTMAAEEKGPVAA